MLRFSVQEKAQCVVWLSQTNSGTQVQRNFRTKFNKAPPSRTTIHAWQKKFLQTGSVLQKKGAGRPRTTAEDVQRVNEAFSERPQMSIRKAGRQLQLPKSTVHKVLRKRLKLFPYKLQLVQALKPDDKTKRMAFAEDILDRIADDPTFLQHVLFSDEATFHVSGMVNKHNVRIWGSENPHETRELERSSPKLNVWCGLMHNQVIGPFFFAEATVTSTTYLDMLENFAIPQLEGQQQEIFYQQDGAPPHWGWIVRDFLNEQFGERWIGRDGPIPWPPRSPDITPLDFFLWGYVKDIVYEHGVRDINDLKGRIANAIEGINEEMLRRTWNEIDYRLNLLRAVNGGHFQAL